MLVKYACKMMALVTPLLSHQHKSPKSLNKKKLTFEKHMMTRFKKFKKTNSRGTSEHLKQQLENLNLTE